MNWFAWFLVFAFMYNCLSRMYYAGSPEKWKRPSQNAFIIGSIVNLAAAVGVLYYFGPL